MRQHGDFLIDDSGPGDDRVGRMVFGAVALGNAAAMPACAHRLDAPSPKCAAEMMVTGQRRKLERGEQAGKSSADHNDAGRRCRRHWLR